MFRISRLFSSRKGVAPAPHTSKTTGIPFWLAATAASFMASTTSVVRVPMLSTSAEAMPVMAATSSGAWAMTGEAPNDFTTWAQSKMVTQLVM